MRDIREKIFKDKEAFHKEMAKLPFEEKIKILRRLQRIARTAKKAVNTEA